MRLICDDGLETEELGRVGYIKVDEEKEVVFSKRDILAAVSVRLVVEGIIGMCFHMKGDDGEYSQEFGDFAKPCDRSGVAQIHCGETLDKIQFLLELDVSNPNTKKLGIADTDLYQGMEVGLYQAESSRAEL